MRTTLTTSIQFGVNNEVINDDIASHVNPANTLPDSQRGNHHIQTNTSGFARYQQHEGFATQGNATTRVQLRTPDGQVQIGQYRTDAASAENLKVMAPEMFVAPEIKAAEAAKASDNAKDEEAQREELGRHADDQLEGIHQHVIGEVSQQNLIGLLVYNQKGEAPPESLLKTIADQMGEPIGTAIDKVNAVAAGVHRQFTNLAAAMGVNPEAAAVWLKDHRKDSSMVATQAHLMRRDVKAWLPLLEEYQAATGDGRTH
jgi:hypothetical protein